MTPDPPAREDAAAPARDRPLSLSMTQLEHLHTLVDALGVTRTVPCQDGSDDAQLWLTARLRLAAEALAARDAALQDARYEVKLFSENYTRDYEREKQRADAAERALSDTVQALQALEATWRDEASRNRPLECAPVSAAKRAGVLRWMLLSNCANALAPILARLRATLAPQADT